MVLIAADDYAELDQYRRRALHVTELPQDVVDELGKVSIPEAASEFNDEYKP